MTSVVGIFDRWTDAERAAQALAAQGIAQDRITVLSPGTPGPTAERLPSTESEPPGIGPALGAVAGGATGASGGVQAAAAASVVCGHEAFRRGYERGRAYGASLAPGRAA